jgi:hypothetical protein
MGLGDGIRYRQPEAGPVMSAGALRSDALLIGAAAGLLPAIRAARLSTTEALWSI